jgi:hypothetical protein
MIERPRLDLYDETGGWLGEGVARIGLRGGSESELFD